MEQLEDNLNAVNIKLSEDEIRRLDEISNLPAEYPQWMIARQIHGRGPGESTDFNKTK